MNQEELIQRLDDIEWVDFEVKSAQKEVPKDVWKTVSSFSNTSGGWIIFGVAKKGKEYDFVEIKNPEKIEQDFTSTLRSGKFNSKITPDCKKWRIENKTILGFYISQKSPRDKPVYFNNPKNTFIRTASGDQKATQEEIDGFFRNSSFEEKDKELSKYGLNALDKETLSRYRALFLQLNPTHQYGTLGDVEFLQKLGVLRDGKVTYGGLLLFGNVDSLQEAFTNYRIEYLEIPGKSYEDASTRYNYRLSSEKNLFLTYFEISERLFQTIGVPFSVKGGFRDDDPPHTQSLREALVNLVMHTDYFSNGNARIRIFNDRYEFFNPGALPKKIELILKEDYSQPRNPIVARAFRFIKLSENIGSGFTKIFSGWKKTYNNLVPLIEGDFDHYKITFPVQPTIKTTIKPTNKSTIKDQIKDILNSNKQYTAEDLSNVLKLNPNTIRYYIQQLKQKGHLIRKGSKKRGHWEVLK